MVLSRDISVASWRPTPALPPMVDLTDPRCATYPPPYKVERVTPEWVGASEGIVCTTYNTSFTYPCCEHLGGTARTWCGRVQCLLHGRRIDDWSVCIGQLMAETGGQAVGLACNRPNPQFSGATMLRGAVGAAGLLALAVGVLHVSVCVCCADHQLA